MNTMCVCVTCERVCVCTHACVRVCVHTHVYVLISYMVLAHPPFHDLHIIFSHAHTKLLTHTVTDSRKHFRCAALFSVQHAHQVFFGWSTRGKCTCSLRRLLQHFLKFVHASSSNSPCQSSLFICNSCNFVHNKLPCEACCSEYHQIVRSRVCHFVEQYFATVYLTCSPLDSKQRIAQTRTLAFDCMCVEQNSRLAS